MCKQTNLSFPVKFYVILNVQLTHATTTLMVLQLKLTAMYVASNVLDECVFCRY